MLPPVIDFRWMLQLVGLSVDANAGEAAAFQLVPKLPVAVQLPALNRGHQINAAPSGQGHYLVDNLIRSLRAYGDIAVRAKWLAKPGHQDAQVIIDLSHGSNGRPRT